MVIYMYYGMGNYYLIIVCIYIDLLFFICDVVLGCDVIKVFNYLLGYVLFEDLENFKILFYMFKLIMIDMIEKEVEYVCVGCFVVIWVKMNSLIEGDVIDVLYCVS